MKPRFGKHKGEEIKDIPSDYLQWIVEGLDPEPLPRLRRGLTLEGGNKMRDESKELISEALVQADIEALITDNVVAMHPCSLAARAFAPDRRSRGLFRHR